MVKPRWDGETVVCIASGASLAPEDCQRIEDFELRTIAVNSSWKAARFAEVVYGGDYAFWKNYKDEIDIDAEFWSCSQAAVKQFKLQLHAIQGGYNSGMRAIQLAMEFGARRIILLGYDCSIKKGIHWHGKHTKTRNPDTLRCIKWKTQFQQVANEAQQKQVEIINCSRYTEIPFFPRQSLEKLLL